MEDHLFYLVNTSKGEEEIDHVLNVLAWTLDEKAQFAKYRYALMLQRYGDVLGAIRALEELKASGNRSIATYSEMQLNLIVYSPR